MIGRDRKDEDAECYARGGHAKHWIQGAIKYPGALHRELHIPAGHKIPMKTLNRASHSYNPTLRHRAQLAKTLRGFHSKG